MLLDVQRCPKDTVLLMSCLSNLCVRNEYCQAVVDNAGLTTIFTLLIDPDQVKFAEIGFALLRVGISLNV